MILHPKNIDSYLKLYLQLNIISQEMLGKYAQPTND